MKKLLFLFSAISLTFFVKAQSPDLPDNWFEILENSSNYYFQGDKYVNLNPLYNSGTAEGYGQSGALARRQAQYDRGFEIIRREWLRLQSLSTINRFTKQFLIKRKVELEQKIPESQQSDLSLPQNVTYWYDIITYHLEAKWVANSNSTGSYEIKGIAVELMLLKKVYNEIIRLKNKSPDDYFNNERFKSMIKLLEELRKCQVSEIPKLSFKYNLY